MTEIMRTDTAQKSNTTNLHPQYRKMMGWAEDGSAIDFARGVWDTMIDCAAGERQIKSRGSEYLPKTGGIIAEELTNPVAAAAAYSSYLTRAQYFEILGQMITSMQGMIFAAPVVCELPGKMSDMVEDATTDHQTVDELARAVSFAQLTTGRIGLLIDPQDGQGIVAPKIAKYVEKSILNWGVDDENTLKWLILDESGYICESATGIYRWRELYRICATEQYEGADGGTIIGDYYTYTRTNMIGLDLTTPPADAQYPEINGKRVQFIPFQIINSFDTKIDCSMPAMIPVANISLSAYRNSADYELALYMTAQPTTVVTGADGSDTIALGANRVLKVKNPDAKIYFHEITGAGIEKQRQAIRDKLEEARAFGVELVENSAESGAALNTRLTVKTSSLRNIADTCEEGIGKTLRMAAEWCGYSPDDVVFTVNKDFKNDQIVPQDIGLLGNEIARGNFSRRDLHKLLVDGQYTTTTDYDEWVSDVESGQAQMPTFSGLQMLAADKNNAEGEGYGNGQE